jgi:hypothetical protein
MSTEITINTNLIEAAELALTQMGGTDEAISITVEGMTFIISPRARDVLSALHTIKRAETTYYLGTPLE